MQKSSIVIFFSILMLVFGCSKNPPQYPTRYHAGGFMEYSKKLNRSIKNIENQYFDEYIKNHPNLNFVTTNSGFKMTKTALNDRLTKDNDTVSYIYAVKDLQDSVIYDYKTIGKKTEVIGHSPMMIGVEYALKRMKPGESAVLLLPSSLAYGTNGDGKKIGSNEPLVVALQLLKNRNQ